MYDSVNIVTSLELGDVTLIDTPHFLLTIETNINHMKGTQIPNVGIQLLLSDFLENEGHR